MTDNEYCKHGSLICWNQCHECSDEEDEQGDKDKRIAELEAALAKCAWHSHIEELEEDAQKFHDDMEKYKADNARLQAELAKANESGEVLHAKYRELGAELASRETKHSAERGQLYLQVDDLKADNARLRDCLKRLEWVDKYTPSGRLMPFCPACGSPKATGHQVDCWLAAEIGGK